MQAKLSRVIRLCACALGNHKPVLLVYYYILFRKTHKNARHCPDQTTSHLNVYQEDVPCESAAKCRLLQKATVPHQDAKGPT